VIVSNADTPSGSPHKPCWWPVATRVWCEATDAQVGDYTPWTIVWENGDRVEHWWGVADEKALRYWCIL
jgi:hypothetical protein